MATTGKLRVRLDLLGRGKVFLNDVDISTYVRGVTILTNVGDVNEIELRVLAGVEIDTENCKVDVKQVIAIDNTSVADEGRSRLMLKQTKKELSDGR